MPLKTHYSNETEIPTELKTFYAERNGRYELQVEGFESVSSVLAKNQELIGRQTKDAEKIGELTAKATQVNSLTQDLANKNAEISRLSNDLTTAQSTQLPSGYVAVAKKDADILKTLKDKNFEVEKVAEVITNFEAVKTENDTFKLEKSIAEFAEVEKVQNVKALTRLIKQDGVLPMIKEVDENGNKVRKGFLTQTVDEKPIETLYGDYKTANWSEFSSALDQTSNQPPNGNGNDPKPFAAPTDEKTAEVALQSQAWSTHNAF